MSDDSVTVSEPVGGRLPAWGSLEILEEIGRGGFGVVYRAWDPALAREVALKVIRPREPRPDALAAILREGQLLARVRHANVVAVHGALQIGDEVGLWMEFVRGRTLSQLVKEDGPRAAGEAAVIGISLCQATAAVHQAGVLHRDIKAHNIMREAGGRIVLMDFGAGQMLDARSDDERASGTPAYMAPEVLAGGRATARSDIYSLGVLLYYLVTGAYPVEGHSWTDFILAHARFERRPLGDVRPDVPSRFVRIVERATALHPDDRYASPGAMLADLSAVVAGGAAAVPRKATRTDSRRKSPAPKPKATSRTWVIAAAIAGPLVGIWALGAVTTIAFNLTLGRSAEYSGESVLYWWVWGFRALIPGLVQATIVALLLALIAAVWNVSTRIAPPAARFAEGVRVRRRAWAARIGLDDPDTAAQALLAAQIAGVAAFCWYFRDIFSASISFIDTASPHDVEVLRPEYLQRHQAYNFTMAMLILAMSAGLYQVLELRRQVHGAMHGSIAISAGVVGISFVVLVLPYRLIWHNGFEMASHDGQRCYILGERAATALLYCPDDEIPKVKEVAIPDPALQRSGRFQSIYTR